MKLYSIAIYHGLGTSGKSLKQTYRSLKLYGSNHTSYISAEEIRQGDWMSSTDLLVFPGGADQYYLKALHGIGNYFIKKFVKKGGSFLGICAGSYYGGSYIEFARSSAIEVVGPRELGFYPGLIKGPLCSYDYHSNKGARVATIKANKPLKDNIKTNYCDIFYNGGGYFVDATHAAHTTILASYHLVGYSGAQTTLLTSIDQQNSLHDKMQDPGTYAAIIECKYGKGKAILSGVHMEYDPYDMFDADLCTIVEHLKQHNQQRILLFQSLLNRFSI